YTVFYGGEIGVFEAWPDVKRSITGHGLAIYAGFPSLQAVQAALDYARTMGWTADSHPSDVTSPLPTPASYEDNPLNSSCSANQWYVVCRGVVPGVYKSYLECSLNTVGVKGNLCCSFETRAEAESVYADALR
ncbi:hypothetical protein GGX14DRAFT_329909, partial [Mycena pura]